MPGSHKRAVRATKGRIFHSDKGSQYASAELRLHLQNYGCWQSMSGADNTQRTQLRDAPMASLWHSMNVVEKHGRAFETR